MLDYILALFLPIAVFGYGLLHLLKDWGKHETDRRRAAAFVLLLLICAGTAITSSRSILKSREQQRASSEQHRADQQKIAQLQSAVEAANRDQNVTQLKLDESRRKLDESLQREQRLNDQANDLRTSIDAQNALLQIVKQSLPQSSQKQADSIRKAWRREVVQTVNVQPVTAH